MAHAGVEFLAPAGAHRELEAVAQVAAVENGDGDPCARCHAP